MVAVVVTPTSTPFRVTSQVPLIKQGTSVVVAPSSVPFRIATQDPSVNIEHVPVVLSNALKYYNIANGVLECINSDLIANEIIGTLGEPGRVCVVPGNEVVWDGCECGQLAIAFQHGPYPSQRFPDETQDGPGRCFIGSTAVRLIASLTRCEYHPQGPDSDPPKPPTCDQQVAAVKLQQVEGYVMRNAITCCLGVMRENRTISDFRVGATDYQVTGACGEVAIIFWVSVV